MKRLLNETELDRVRKIIEAVEQKTDAELVTVLAARADDYRMVVLFWAAMVALLLPGLYSLLAGNISADGLVLANWLTFILAVPLFRIPFITQRLVPTGLRYWRASNLARRQFLDLNLHRTQGASGMLIFVSQAERYVEILVDHGIASRVDNAHWASIVQRFTERVRKGETAEGFLECIQSCGQTLAEVLPATHARNELPDHLVLLD